MIRKKKNNIIYHILTLLGGILMLYPLIWMLMSSFKETNTIINTATQLFPEVVTFDNYQNGWRGVSHTTFGVFIKNTAFVTLTVVFGSLLSSSLMAYGLSRLRFKGRNILFALVLLTMMLPEQVMMIPQYLWYHNLGWVNSFKPLIIPYFFAIQGFFVYLLMNFINGIPRELDEAAKIDGCSYYTIFTKIFVPLMKPGLGTVAIFAFINRWNDYMAPLLYLKKTKMYTISIALKLYCDPSSTSDYGAMFAMSTISLVPVLLIFIFLQKYLVEGMSTQGLKG